jgi:hypothetical protein
MHGMQSNTAKDEVCTEALGGRLQPRTALIGVIGLGYVGLPIW